MCSSRSLAALEARICSRDERLDVSIFLCRFGACQRSSSSICQSACRKGLFCASTLTRNVLSVYHTTREQPTSTNGPDRHASHRLSLLRRTPEPPSSTTARGTCPYRRRHHRAAKHRP